ncbi:MAG: hypothetical protein H0X03_05880 [Nitrosopumilus sp.]|nr:hypothetical protein [Nitrosopumilus sp.]
MDISFKKNLKCTDKEIILNWNDIDKLIECICRKIKIKLENVLKEYEIIAITNGGIIPATIISYSLGINIINLFPIINKKIIHEKMPFFDKTKRYLLIDEIYDTGKTFKKTSRCLKLINHLDIFLVKRYNTNSSNNQIYGKILDDHRWVVFPWEKTVIN